MKIYIKDRFLLHFNHLNDSNDVILSPCIFSAN